MCVRACWGYSYIITQMELVSVGGNSKTEKKSDFKFPLL